MNKKILLVIVGLVLAFGAGYALNQNNENTNQPVTTTKLPPETKKTSDSKSLANIATYTLPDGWREASCPDSEAVYVVRGGSDPDCGENPAAPIKLSIDAGNTKDCNELQNVTNVKKHTCSSLFINDLRTLKASTEYLESSSYGKALTINAYYIDTGSEIVKVEYVFEGDAEYQTDFEQLANSVNKK